MTSKLTRERLAKIKSWRETYGAGSNVMLPAEEAEELARIVLAAMESEPVAWKVRFKLEGQPGSNFNKFIENRKAMNDVVSLHELGGFSIDATPLYRHAQPVPVVPDELKEAAADLLATLDDYPEQLVPINRKSSVVRALRAAMLAADH